MKYFYKLLLAALLAASCTGSLTPLGEIVDIEGNVLSHEMIVLGQKLEDPYTVANMTKALDALYSTRADRGSVTTTDLYVRFLPNTEDDFKRLESLGVVMLDHPMDYEIIKEGDYYHDPSLPEENITWQYAVVPKDFSFPPSIRHEILDECFIPENSTTKAEWVNWDAVERESFRLTGNLDMLEEETKAAKSYPAGNITIVDSRNGKKEGLKGVTVSCNVFVKFSHAFTDENGNYSMTKGFAINPRYRLMFKNSKGFGIGFNLLLVPASCSTLGKGSASGLDFVIDAASDRSLFRRSVVNNAAFDYYESCTGTSSDIKTPPQNLRIWLLHSFEKSAAMMLQQGAIVDASALNKFFGSYLTIAKLFLPDITIGMKGKDSFDVIYAETVHELAHTSHYMQVGNEYWNNLAGFNVASFISSGFVTYGTGTETNHGYCEIAEMWAFYIQTQMMNTRYEEYKEYGTSYWFYPQIFNKLDERGIDRYKIFTSLTSDVTDKELLKKRLINLYPDGKSIINQVFGYYN